MNEIIKRMNEIKARRAEIRGIVEAGGEADLEALTTELRSLDTEMSTLEARKTLIEGINAGSIPASSIPNPFTTQERTAVDIEKEYRNAWLKNLMGKELTDAEKRAFSSASNSAGGAIPETISSNIIKKIYEVAPILERCKIFHVPGNFRFVVEGTNNAAALHTENASISAASDTVGTVSLTGYEIVKLVKASAAVVNMTISAFESYIVDILAEDIARKLEEYIFTGTGSSQPGGVAQGGKGTNGAYTSGTDLVEVAATASLADTDIMTAYGYLGSGYERNAVWAMSKNTFFSYVYPLMNKSKNNLVEFANGKYYIVGCEVYFTGSLTKGIMYFGDYTYIVGNFSQDITVAKSEHSGFATNSVDFRGACIFDSKAVAGLGAFVKVNKKQS